MKSIIYKLAAAAAGLSMMLSCSEDYMELDKGSDTLQLTADAETVTLQEINSSADAIALNWTSGNNFGTGNRIYYTLEIDREGNNFANPYVAVDNESRVYSWSESVEGLNDILRRHFGVDAATVSLEARVTASVPDVEELQTASAAFSVTTYEPVTKTLYLIGDATPNGWSADNATAMTRTSNGVFTWTGNLNTGDFKFITTLGEFYPSYAWDTEGNLILREGDDDPDEKYHIDAYGRYQVDVNLLTGVVKVAENNSELPAFEHLYLVGNMTSWGFEEMRQDPLDPFLFRMGRFFDIGGEFKFGTRDGSWENMLKATYESAPYTETEMVFVSSFDPDNKWVLKDEETGRAYKICVDIRSGKERMMMKEFTPYGNIWLVGDSTPGGWSLDSATPMTVSADDPYVMTWEGSLTEGELKFSCDCKSDWNGAWFLAFEDGSAPAGEEERMLFVDKSDSDFKAQYLDTAIGDVDRKWKVTSAGTYSITLNQLTETVTIVKK